MTSTRKRAMNGMADGRPIRAGVDATYLVEMAATMAIP
jgi:hypothetical protein